MVSFQCDACGDTVKKPKLDQHYQRCYSSVTCIDCSKTFNSPAEWKGHTSCISEAEKYQKGLYKGPKGAGAPGQQSPQTNGRPQQQWQQQGRFGNNGGGGQQAVRRPSGTGANTTPLGTPKRMSPAEAVPVPEKTVEKSVASHGVNGVKEAKTNGQEAKKEKEKKEKKEKTTKETPVVQQEEKAAPVNGATDATKPKKERSKRKETAVAEAAPVPPPVTEGVAKTSKKRKERPDEAAVPVLEDGVKKKRKNGDGEAGGVPVGPPNVVAEVVNGKKEKKKSKKADVTEGIAEVAPAPPEIAAHATNGGVKKTKEKKSKLVADSAAPTETAVTPAEPAKDKKKRKVHGEGEVEGGKQKKKSKVAATT